MIIAGRGIPNRRLCQGGTKHPWAWLLGKPDENAWVVEFGLRNIPVSQKYWFAFLYKTVKVGDYFPDLIAVEKVIVETKTLEKITHLERGQVINYLKLSRFPVGVILSSKQAKTQQKCSMSIEYSCPFVVLVNRDSRLVGLRQSLAGHAPRRQEVQTRLNAPLPDNRFGKRKLRIARIGAKKSLASVPAALQGLVRKCVLTSSTHQWDCKAKP